MSSRFRLSACTVLFSALVTFGSVFAQDAGNTSGTGGGAGTTGSDARTTSSTRDRDRDFDYGWLGLAGLIGLAGLARRDRNDHAHVDRSVNR